MVLEVRAGVTLEWRRSEKWERPEESSAEFLGASIRVLCSQYSFCKKESPFAMYTYHLCTLSCIHVSFRSKLYIYKYDIRAYG